MTPASLFQWVLLKQDIPDSSVKMGDRGVVVDLLPPNDMHSEPGYTLEIFKDGETFDIVSIPCSWGEPLRERWSSSPFQQNKLYDSLDKISQGNENSSKEFNADTLKKEPFPLEQHPYVSLASQTSDPMLSKLLEAEADLETQMATVKAQLEAIHEQRRSLHSVIEMFSATSGVPAPTEARETSDSPESSPSTKALQKTGTATSVTANQKDESQPDETSSAAVTPSPQRARKSDSTVKKTKRPRKVQGWGRYIRAEFSRLPLAEAVKTVLSSNPDAVLAVSDILKALFVEDTPTEVLNGVQSLVSDVLSNGLRARKWYRGKTGQYSLSRQAVRPD